MLIYPDDYPQFETTSFYPDNGMEEGVSTTLITANDLPESMAAMIDPSRGDLYTEVSNMVQSLIGLNDNGAYDEYTYYGLPAVGASSDIFNEENDG